MLEDVERLRVADRDFERLIRARVDHADAQIVVDRIPEERDFEPIGASLSKFPAVHGPIVPTRDNGPITAS
jgi:hypothetical protein